MAIEDQVWCPTRVRRESNGEFVVDQITVNDERFTDPFFNDTIRRLRAAGRETRTVLLDELPRDVAPSGFIFHMSRCGSTLVSQMLAACGKTFVISEAPPVDDVIRLSGKREHLRSIVAALDSIRGGDRHFFIKLDSWHALSIDLIERAFPNVPWIFLFRDPADVIASHIRRPGSQMVPGTMNDIFDIAGSSREEYCAKVLGRICDATLAHSSSANALFVNYSELPAAVYGRIADHFRIKFSYEDVRSMKAASERDAKTPALRYEPRSDLVTERINVAAAAFVSEQYARLCHLAANGG